MNPLPTALLLVALGLTPTSALAQAPLTLREAIEQAIAQNPELKAAESRVQATRARETQASAWPNPNLTLSVDEAPFADPLNGSLMAGVSQPLMLGTQRSALLETAALERAIAELERDALRLERVSEVKQAYARLLFAQESLRHAAQDAEAAGVLLKAMQTRFKAGEIARVEVLRAEVERDKSLRVVSSAEGRLRQEKGRLNVLMGRTAQEAIAIQPLALPDAGNLPALPALVAQSLESRAELQRAELAIRREAAQRRLAQSAMWTGTEVSVAAGLVEGQPGFTTSLTVPIPFYRQQGEIKEAEANRLRAEAERQALRHRITLEVEEAYQEALDATQQIALFRKRYLPQSERLVDNAQRRFQAGEGSGLEVIEALHAQRETRAEYQQALLEYRQAVASLERATGRDLPE
jgi:cobalt-zinc-cadmium efflux system outer membrane protein